MEKIINSKGEKLLAINLPEDKTHKLYTEFKAKAKKARRVEMQNVGINPVACVNEYRKAITVGWQLLKKYDQSKSKKIKKFRMLYIIKKHSVGFFLGILASMIASKLVCQ